MLRGKSASSTTLELDMATADVHAPTTSYDSKAIRKNTLGSKQILGIVGIIAGLTIFTMVVSIMDDGFHLVSTTGSKVPSVTNHTIST